MDTKLTIKLDSTIIEEAKVYAKKQNTSLSKLIENYLGVLMQPNKDSKVTPLVKSLSGVIKLPKNFDHKAGYKKHLGEKYGQ